MRKLMVVNSHNMKNLFLINEEEKNRILNLHETATKRHYLSEQVKQGQPGDPYEYKLEDGIYYFKNTEKGETRWTKANKNQSDAIKTKIFGGKTDNTTQTKNDKSTKPQKVSPFKSIDWGNHFRLWVNQNLPSVANKFKLSKKGPHDNKNIIDTWNYDLPLKGGKTMKLGEYYKLKNPDLELKSKIESGYFPVPTKIEGSDRINKELLYISKRKEYSGKPFFIADPLHNLVLAFDEKHKLIDYSQSVAGADKQPDEVFTYKDWCEASNLKYDPYRKRCVGEEVTSAADSNKVKIIQPSLNVLSQISKRSQKEGIYQVRSTRYEPTYQGQSGQDNLFYLETKDGIQVPTAIHGLVNTQPRIVADKELSEFLQKEKQFGRIPKEYVNAVETLTLKYNLSSGCFNVSAEFVNNPEVIRIAKNKAFVFIMSERKENYLVQVTPDKQDDFFTGLRGDGRSCKSMESIGIKVGGQSVDTAIA
jgi:hypothetical protein